MGYYVCTFSCYCDQFCWHTTSFYFCPFAIAERDVEHVENFAVTSLLFQSVCCNKHISYVFFYLILYHLCVE